MCLGFLCDLLRTRGLVYLDEKHAQGASEALKRVWKVGEGQSFSSKSTLRHN